jgi:hypothetical protein
MRIFLTVLFCLLFVPDAQAKLVMQIPVAGKAAGVAGEVTIAHNGAPTFVPLHAGDTIYVSDIIETGAQSRAQIIFADGTDLIVGSNGKVTIDEYVFDPAKPDTGHAHTSILNAAFQYVDGALGKVKKPDVRLDLNFGSIGIRGTKILRGMKGGECWVYLADGDAYVYNDKGSVPLKPGQGTKMTDKKVAPVAAQDWTDADVEWIRAELRPAESPPLAGAPPAKP